MYNKMSAYLTLLCSIITLSGLAKVQELTQGLTLSPFTKQTKKREQVVFSFDKKSLISIIDFLASKLAINIVLPQLAADVEILKQQTVTFRPRDKETVSLEKAWQLLHTFLDLAGFSLFAKTDTLYAIVKSGSGKPNETGIAREPLPLYISTPLDELPKTDERIRYIVYLQNLKVPQAGETDNPISQIFKDMLSPGATAAYNSKSNGIVITDKASVITSIMHIINELDATGLRESVAVVPLYNISAQEVIKVFDLLKKAAGDDRTVPFIRESVPLSPTSYFATDTKIIADDRTNAVILMGRETAVERISEFIHEHMDVLPQSGKSVLHTYDLQYLDAENFAGVLQTIVAAQPQATQANQAVASGNRRFFSGVQIAAERRIEVKVGGEVPGRIGTENVTLIQDKTTSDIKGIEGRAAIGGNRLIVVALQDDWIHIKDLIEKLDQPQPQVILEVAIVDFTYDSLTKVAGSNRSPTNLAFPNDGFQYLASHITPVNNVLGTNPTQLAQDLLAVVKPPNVPSALETGSVLLSFNDPATPGIWGLLQLLQQYLNTKIVTHPFLISSNNQKSTVESTEYRRTNGELIPSINGTFTIPTVDVTATLKVELVPRLASLERLRLEIGVTIQDFAGSSFNRLNRSMVTTVTMGSGQILALGGLLRNDDNAIITKTPLVADVPFFGWLFKSDQERTIKTNIVIFVSPHIIHPRVREPLNVYTADKLEGADKITSDDALLGKTKDPIIHFFFKHDHQSQELIRDYLAHASNQKEITSYPSDEPKKEKPLIHLLPSKTSFTQPPEVETDKIRELLAYEDNPLLRIKHSESKVVFNG